MSQRRVALIVGWFSFKDTCATAGDIMSAEVVRDWLASVNITADIGVGSPWKDGVLTSGLKPERYSYVIAVCGPHFKQSIIRRLPGDYGHCRQFGIGLSIIGQLAEALESFDVLYERDSERCVRPDLAFQSGFRAAPVVGLLLVHMQLAYGPRACHFQANESITKLLREQTCAVIKIDTLLAGNASGLRTADEIESLIAKMDCVVSTRLHGTVLALKHGIPALAVDPIAGGAKVSAQCRAVGWPVCFTADRLNDQDLAGALQYCLSAEGKARAAECRDRACHSLDGLRIEFLREFEQCEAVAQIASATLDR
jgi:hypothetical protein